MKSKKKQKLKRLVMIAARRRNLVAKAMWQDHKGDIVHHRKYTRFKGGKFNEGEEL